MELQYRDSAIHDLQTFVTRYEEAFYELYEDTGLWNEAGIRESYHQKAMKLYDVIADNVDQRLEESKVLGRKKLQGNTNEVDFYVRDRLIIVHYSEDKEADIRWVESISIDRKPIIF